jgi:hypothetical protein
MCCLGFSFTHGGYEMFLPVQDVMAICCWVTNTNPEDPNEIGCDIKPVLGLMPTKTMVEDDAPNDRIGSPDMEPVLGDVAHDMGSPASYGVLPASDTYYNRVVIVYTDVSDPTAFKNRYDDRIKQEVLVLLTGLTASS